MPVWHSRREGWLLVDGLETAGWKGRLSWLGAVPLAALFLVSGVWKITSPLGWAARIGELRAPHAFSLAAALAVGIAETVGAVWILAPRFRRWGAILIGLMLAGFMAWFALHYGALRGADCSCFPWVRRVVGPGFFAGDLAMLALAVLAGLGARRPAGARAALAIAATVAVFALVSYGVETQRATGAPAPPAVTVNGEPYPIGRGRFFGPEQARRRRIPLMIRAAGETVDIKPGQQRLGIDMAVAGAALQPARRRRPARRHARSFQIAAAEPVLRFCDSGLGRAREQGNRRHGFPFVDQSDRPAQRGRGGPHANQAVYNFHLP